MRANDLDWKHGRHGAYVWYANDELEDVLREAFGMFLVENGLGMRAFPSIARMENEVLSMVRGLLGGDDETAGIFTSGGTESIFLAMFALREWAKEAKRGVSRPQIVAPHSAHPALNKAAFMLGLDVKRVPVGADFRADPAAIEAAIGPNTVGLYASAPSYSLGMVDPILELGAIAGKHQLWLHVDACVGGILAPFVREGGYDVPVFDFSAAGVTSISADLHKSGFAAKPASTVSFRTRAHRDFARYTFDDWPSGTYTSLTFTGTRPGGAIAASWAALNFLGREGYREIAAAIAQVAEQRGVPLLVNIAAAPLITEQGYKHVFRNFYTAPNLIRQGLTLMKDLFTATGRAPKTAVLMHVSDTFGQANRVAIDNLFPQLDMPFEIVGKIPYDPATKDLSIEVAKARSANADLLMVVPRLNDAILLVREMVKQRWEPMGIVSPGSPGLYEQQFLKALGKLADYATTNIGWYNPRAELAPAVLAQYRKRFGNDPWEGHSFNAGFTFEAVLIAADAFARARSTAGPALTEALRRTRIEKHLMTGGPIEFDAKGQNNNITSVVLQNHGGVPRVVLPASVAEAKPVFPAPGWTARS